jgi:4-hydroxybenzoate polyprenyltransferase
MIVLLFGLLQFVSKLGVLYSTGVFIVARLLIYEHSLVRPDDLSAINMAFLNVNGVIRALGLWFLLSPTVCGFEVESK